MVTLMISDCWRCETCGHVVLDDGCGFLYVEGKVRNCERCPDPLVSQTTLTPVDPILNVAEEAGQ